MSESFDHDGHVRVGELFSKFRESLNGLPVLLKRVLILVELEDAHHVRLDLIETVRIISFEELGILDDGGENDIGFLLEMGDSLILSRNLG